MPTLKTRPEFGRVRGGGRAEARSFLIEGKPRIPPTGGPDVAVEIGGDEPIGVMRRAGVPSAGVAAGARPAVATVSGARFGFTITKKIGSAVVRNRIRRRLKAALTQLYDTHTQPDMDYVVVARRPAFEQSYSELTADLAIALAKVNAAARRGPTSRRRTR